MNPNKSDNELMNEFACCSKDSFTEIFERYKNRILNFVLRGFLHDKDDAEEIVQKTFIRVYECKYKYRTTNQFSTWVYTIAKNFSLNELKRVKNFRPENNESDNPASENCSPLRETELNNFHDLLLKFIEQLKPKYRQVIVLRFLQGLSYEEISKITSTRVNTLKSHSKRGLKQIHDQMKRYGIEEEQISAGN